MKKILIMFAMLLACSVAFAQNDTIKNSKDKSTRNEKTSIKHKSDTGQPATNNQSKSKSTEKSTTTAPAKRERANGTTGTIQHPDTEGAGTGTGNDSHIGAPPGQPEKTEK